jgi:hypothetical protein
VTILKHHNEIINLVKKNVAIQALMTKRLFELIIFHQVGISICVLNILLNFDLMFKLTRFRNYSGSNINKKYVRCKQNTL